MKQRGAAVLKTVERGEYYPHSAVGKPFGICVYFSDGTVLRVEDATDTAEAAERFLARLCGELVDATQLSYLLEDFLAEEYTV